MRPSRLAWTLVGALGGPLGLTGPTVSDCAPGREPLSPLRGTMYTRYPPSLLATPVTVRVVAAPSAWVGALTVLVPPPAPYTW